LNDLKEIRTQPVSEKELRQAKLMLLRDIPLAESSVDWIAQVWLKYSALDMPLDEPVRAGTIYTQLTAADVQNAFAKWIRSDSLVQVTQGPPPQ
jgi:zinc protease